MPGHTKRLQVQRTRELLYAVEQQIAFLNHVAILRILQVRAVSDNYASDLVDLGAEAIGGDESTDVIVDEVRRNTKRRGHGLERNTLVCAAQQGRQKGMSYGTAIGRFLRKCSRLTCVKKLLVGQDVELAHPE